MLNARLYRTAWLIAGVAVVVALLTLQPPSSVQALERPSVPPAADGPNIARAALELRSLAPGRPPGSPAAEDTSVKWVTAQFQALSRAGAKLTVRRQVFVARVDGRLERMVNVYAVLPGTTAGIVRGGIVIVAPRDTGPGVTSGSANTALMLEVARLEATSPHRRPILLVSTSGSTTGNAGARWFLSRFSDFPISAAIVIDGLGERDGPVWIWPGARTPTQSLAFADITRQALIWSGASAAPEPGLWTQLLHYAVPQTFGDQAPFVARGIPAITLSSRPDGPARPVSPPSRERLQQAGNVVLTLVSLADGGLNIPAPEAGVLISGKELRPGVLRVVLLLFALPLLVVAFDAFIRIRRSGMRTGPGLQAASLRAAPLVVMALAMHVLSLMHMLPQPSAGVPPLPREVGFGTPETVAVVVTVVLGALTWLLSHHALRRLGAAPASEAAAGLVVLGAITLLAWFVTPYVLVMTLPASHAVLVATSVSRRWHVAALGVVGLLPLIALCLTLGSQLGRSPFFSVWYLLTTTAGGARGTLWPVFALLLTCAILSMVILVIVRFQRGLMQREPGRRRVPRPRLVAKARLPRIER